MNLGSAGYPAYALLAATLLGAAAFLFWACKKGALHRRLVLLSFALLGLSPALYTALVWARLIGDRYLRFERPL